MSGNPLLDLVSNTRKRDTAKPPVPAEPLDKAFRDLNVKGGLKTVQKARREEESLRPSGLGDARRVARSRLKADPATHDVVESAMYMNAVDSKGNLIQPDTPVGSVRDYSVRPEVRDAIIKEFKDDPEGAIKKYGAQRDAYREFRNKTIGGAKTPDLKSQQPGAFEQTGTVPAPLDPEQTAAEALNPNVDRFVQSGIDDRRLHERLDEAVHQFAKGGEDIGNAVASAIPGPQIITDVWKNVAKFLGGTGASIVATPATILSAIDFSNDETKPGFDRAMSFVNALVQMEGVAGSPVIGPLLGRALKGGWRGMKALFSHLSPAEESAIVKGAGENGEAVGNALKGVKQAVQEVPDEVGQEAFTKAVTPDSPPPVAEVPETPVQAPETTILQGVPNASQVQETATLHGDVREQPPVVEQTVPAQESGPGIQQEAPKEEVGTTALHSEAQKYADEFGLTLEKNPKSWESSLADARSQGLNTEKNALSVAGEVLAKRSKKVLSQTEKLGLLDRLHTLRNERSALAKKIADGTATDIERSQYDGLTEQGGTLYKALFKSGSETGRSLNAQKAWLEGPLDDVHLTAKWSSKLGRDLTATESQAVKDLAAKHAETQAKLDDALVRITRLEAERAIARKSPRAGTSFTRTVTKDQAIEALGRLGTVVQPGQLGSGLGGFKVRWSQEDSEALRTVVKYVYEGLAEKGVHTLEAVKTNVRALMPDKEIDDVTLHQAIKDALGSEGRTVNRGRTYGEDVLQSGPWAVKDPEVARWRAKLDGIKQEADSALGKALEDQKWADAKGLEKSRLVSKDFLQSARTLMTTLDDSAVGRQSWLVGLTNPGSWGKGLANHWKGLTHDGYLRAVEDLRAGSGYELGQQAGLKHRTVVGEEMYGGRMLQHIPGVKQAVNTSERVFDLQTDYASQHAFDSMVRLTGADLGEAKVYADFVNTLSGKTNLKLGDAEVLAFAPKFAWSRFKALNAPLFIGRAAKAGYQAGGVRQAVKAGGNVAYQYAKAGAMLSGLFAAAQAGGWKVGTDPSSSDFGKIRKGDFVVDLTAGEAQAAQFAYRMYNSMFGSPRYFRGAAVSPVDEMVQFGRKKLAPLPGSLVNLGGASSAEQEAGQNNMGEGRNLVGQDVTWRDELGRSVVPLGVSQQLGLKDPSPEDRFWSALAEFFGHGTSQYPERERERK